MKLKQRRGPYGRLPAEIACHGFVPDLVQTVTDAARTMGAQAHIHKKNDDYYISVLVPSVAELAEMDRQLESENQS